MAARFDPNNLFWKMWNYYWLEKDEIDPETGKKALIKIFNRGSSRSSKTVDAIHLIVALIDYYASDKGGNQKLVIDVYRDTLVRCRDLTFEVDFKKALRDYIIFEVQDKWKKKSDQSLWEQCRVTTHPKPKIEWKGSVINFKGVMETDTQPAFCDISFFNEVMEVQNMEFIRSVFMRTSKLAICDWNPTNSQHQIYKYQGQFNCLFTHTTFLDNKHCPDQQYSEIISKCPWDLADYDFETKTWLRPEVGEGEIYDETKHRRPNKKNIENGTATKRGWLVYGEGMDAPAEGCVFPDVEWISNFPDDYVDRVIWGLDFGFTNHESCLTKVGIKNKKELYIEYKIYKPTRNVDILYEAVKPHLLEEEKYLKSKLGENYEPEMWIVCDSQDKFEGEFMVSGLNNKASEDGKNWNFVKAQKPRVVVRIEMMKRYKLFCVRKGDDTHPTKFAETEFKNYIFGKFPNGQPTNEPEDAFNHGMDSWGYTVLIFAYDD